MLKPLPGFDKPLTNWQKYKSDLDLVIKQLEKYSMKEGRDFIIVEDLTGFAVYINYQSVG